MNVVILVYHSFFSQGLNSERKGGLCVCVCVCVCGEKQIMEEKAMN